MSRSPSGVDFGALSELRKLALGTFDWCGVCGLPFSAEARWQVVMTAADDDRPLHQLEFSEAPVHETCAIYAAQVCPYLSSPGGRMGDELRKGQVRGPIVRIVGFAHTVDVRARESQLQRGTFVLHFSHAGRVDCVAYTQPNELADRYRELLSNETMPETTLADRTLIRLFNRVDDDDSTVTGAAVMAGAAFARDIFRIQGMHVFNRQAYQGFARCSCMTRPAGTSPTARTRQPAPQRRGSSSAAMTYPTSCANGAALVAVTSDSPRPIGSVLAHRVDGDGLPATDSRSGSIARSLGEALS